jgi:hypothetical protein
MALAVASTSTAQANNNSTVTVTKPSGVASGDLLLIIASKYNEPAITCTGFSEAFNVNRSGGGNTDFYLTLLWRIADSSDVSASNYAVQMAADDDGGNACMFRITGWTSGTPSFIFSDSDTAIYTNAATPSTLGMSGIAIPRPSAGILIQAHTLNTNDSDAVFSFSTYTAVSSGSNPSWTEVRDAGADVNTSVNLLENHLAVAYATFTDTSTVTAYSASFTESITDDIGWGSFIVSLCEPVDQTGTNALLNVSPTIFANAGATVDGNGNTALLSVSPNFPNQSGESTVPTVWTPTPKS